MNPRLIEAMAETGVDINHNRTKSFEEFFSRNDLDLVGTVCDHAKESCPMFNDPVKHIHLDFEAPALYVSKPDTIALPIFRKILDQIKETTMKKLNEEF